MRPGNIMLTALVLALLTMASAGLSQNSADPAKMSAREIFYTAPKAKKIAKRPTAPPRPAPPRTPAPEPPAPGPLEVAKSAPPTPPPAPMPAPPTPSAPEVAVDTPPLPPAGNEQFINATLVDAPQLGLRCSVLKRQGASELFEVDSESVFHSGDRIRLRVTANDDGYLYVILRGSSGVWKPLFPSKEVAGGSNRVSGGRPYEIPQGHVFTFDDQPGEEKLFVVVSRTPVESLESLIYNLGSETPAETPAKTPAATPAKPPVSPDKLLLAENRININDSQVDRLRLAYARDLIIEKVDDSASGGSYGKETAVYAVAAMSDTDSRVVVDLTLTHR